MPEIIWKVLIFVSVAASALFIFELALMWSLLRVEGIHMVFDRRFDGTLQIAREIAVLTISALWIVSKGSMPDADSYQAMCDRRVTGHSGTSCHPAEFLPTVTSHFPTRGYLHEKAPHPGTVASPG